MRIALDTNILVYAAGVDRGPDDGPKIAAARETMRKLAETATLIAPTQALGELFVVLQRAGYSRAEARAIGEHHLEMFDRHRLRFRRPVDVHELGENKFDLVFGEQGLRLRDVH